MSFFFTYEYIKKKWFLLKKYIFLEFWLIFMLVYHNFFSTRIRINVSWSGSGSNWILIRNTEFNLSNRGRDPLNELFRQQKGEFSTGKRNQQGQDFLLTCITPIPVGQVNVMGQESLSPSPSSILHFLELRVILVILVFWYIESLCHRRTSSLCRRIIGSTSCRNTGSPGRRNTGSTGRRSSTSLWSISSLGSQSNSSLRPRITGNVIQDIASSGVGSPTLIWTFIKLMIINKRLSSQTHLVVQMKPYW